MNSTHTVDAPAGFDETCVLVELDGEVRALRCEEPDTVAAGLGSGARILVGTDEDGHERLLAVLDWGTPHTLGAILGLQPAQIDAADTLWRSPSRP